MDASFFSLLLVRKSLDAPTRDRDRVPCLSVPPEPEPEPVPAPPSVPVKSFVCSSWARELDKRGKRPTQPPHAYACTHTSHVTSQENRNSCPFTVLCIHTLHVHVVQYKELTYPCNERPRWRSQAPQMKIAVKHHAHDTVPGRNS